MDMQCVLSEVRTDVLCVNYTNSSVQRDDSSVSSLSQIQELFSGNCKWATSVTGGQLYTGITFTSLLVIRFNVVGV